MALVTYQNSNNHFAIMVVDVDEDSVVKSLTGELDCFVIGKYLVIRKASLDVKDTNLVLPILQKSSFESNSVKSSC